MRIRQKRTEGQAGDRAMRRGGASLRRMAAGVVVACAMSGAGAAGPVGANGVVRFTGALVEHYDVTFEAPPAVSMAAEKASDAATATLRFDAHGRHLPGAQVALLGLDGAPLGRPERSGIRATWRDAAAAHVVPLPAGGVHRVGPSGGSLMLAAVGRASGTPAPVVIRIRHP